MKLIRNPYALIILFVIIIIVLKAARISLEWVGVSIVWLVGLAAVLQSQIQQIFFPPMLKVSIREVTTTTIGAYEQKWYNLVIKNDGYSAAKNVRIKIRDDESKSWINLSRPFAGAREDKIFVPTLTVGE